MRKCKLWLLGLCILSFLTLQANAKDENDFTHLHIVDIDNPIPFEDIKTCYKAYDAKDGFITEQISFESLYETDYLSNCLKVKTYELVVTVTNSRNYTTKLYDEISVRDFTAPIITSLNQEITIDISKDTIEEILKQNLIYEDNYDEAKHYIFEGIETAKLGVGTYSIPTYAIDNCGNISNTIIFVLHIIETIKRQISTTPIYINEPILTKEELLATFLKNEVIDTSYQTVQVKSTYLNTPHKSGIYQAEFSFLYADGLQYIYQCKIINEPKQEKKKENTLLYISLGVMTCMALIGIIIYRKRL